MLKAPARTRQGDPEPAAQRPLCVDLDGTLIKTDLLFELFLLLLKKQPLTLFKLPQWLLRGKAALKHELASRVTPDVSTLPYRETLLEYLKAEKARGRPLVLATAASERVARQVADHLGLFDEVLASDARENLSGEKKADVLSARYGEGGFSYVADAPVDKAVWRRAGTAVIVGARTELSKDLNNVEKTLPEPVEARAFFRALRLHQWVKNLLVFVPLALSHQVTQLPLIGASLVAFVAFCLCASSVYLMNDLLDLEADRHHASKRHRPFASGALPVKVGLIASPALLLAAFALSLVLSAQFTLVLALYFAATLLYSLLLKQKPIVDVLTLALLYTTRIIAGAVAIGAPLSPWLLAFSLFFFLSLAYIKRYTELHDHAHDVPLKGRGYVRSDIEGLSDLGVSSGYVAVLVVALYINSQDVVRYYQNPSFLWLICPLMVYWISRAWLIARRGKMHDDPIVFALKDRVSHVVALLVVGAGILASL